MLLLWKTNVVKQAINDILQGTVATYLKSMNIWQTFKHERDCLVHYARLANTLLKDG